MSPSRRGASDSARAARKGVSVQHARAYRRKLLDRCGGSDNARRDDRGQQRYRRGQRRYERYSGECRGLRQSLPRREGDKRARPRVLLQRQTNHERDF